MALGRSVGLLFKKQNLATEGLGTSAKLIDLGLSLGQIRVQAFTLGLRRSCPGGCPRSIRLQLAAGYQKPNTGKSDHQQTHHESRFHGVILTDPSRFPTPEVTAKSALGAGVALGGGRKCDWGSQCKPLWGVDL